MNIGSPAPPRRAALAFIFVTVVLDVLALGLVIPVLPSMQSLMSRKVAPDEQGRLQGAYSSIMGITGMLGPTLFTGVFASFIGPRAGLHLPGAPFLLAAAFMLVALLVAQVATREPRAAPAR